RRLQSVEEDGRPLARYTHNAFGQTIRRETKQQTQEYDYINNQLSAERDRHGVRRRCIYAHQTPVGVIEYDHKTNQGQLFFIHADLLGARTLVTDAQNQIVWAASYHHLAEATILKENLTLNFRPPGQVYDPATAWHDNLLRTYLPHWGQHAEPDPLGAMPYNQAYRYALQQPHRYIDPLGLLL